MTLKRTLFAAALLAVACATHAQKFPEKPITLIVPWPPGGSTDIALRALAESTSKHLPQRVVIENRPGVGGTLGAQHLAQNAKPDGYTVAQMPITVFRHPHMTKTAYDPMSDFTWIIHLTGYTFGVIVRADSPFKTFRDLVDYARANPGKLTYGTPGNGTSLHVTMEQIAIREKIQWTQVPFKGGADNLASLLGGHTMALADSTGWAEAVNAGKARLLVTWGAQRTKRWPDVPTAKELGYDILASSSYGIGGPRGMDPKVVRILHDAFRKGLDDPEFVRTQERLDQVTSYLNTEDYTRWAREQYAIEKKVVEKFGLRQ